MSSSSSAVQPGSPRRSVRLHLGPSANDILASLIAKQSGSPRSSMASPAPAPSVPTRPSVAANSSTSMKSHPAPAPILTSHTPSLNAEGASRKALASADSDNEDEIEVESSAALKLQLGSPSASSPLSALAVEPLSPRSPRGVPAESAEEKERKRCNTRTRLAQEILSTEKSYLHSIETMHRIYVKPLADAGSDAVISADEQKIIFNEIILIIELNRHFCRAIEDRMANWNEESTILSDLFIRYAPYFKIYSVFVQSHDRSARLLTEISKKSAVKEWLSKQYQIAEGNGNSLSSFLITPIQRVPRYLMLIQQLIKFTLPTHPDLSQLKVAEQLISESAMYINESIRDFERKEFLIQLQSKFQGNLVLLHEGRKFLKQGTLTKQGRRSDSKYEFFLFNDCLLYASSQLGKYKLHHQLSFNANFAALDTPDRGGEDEKYRIQIISREKSFVISCKDLPQKAEWLTAITTAVEAAEANLFEFPSRMNHLTPPPIQINNSMNQSASIAVLNAALASIMTDNPNPAPHNMNSFKLAVPNSSLHHSHSANGIAEFLHQPKSRSRSNSLVPPGTESIARRSSLSVEAELGTLPPTFVQFKSHPQCALCSKSLSLFTRDHCQACGEVICNDVCGSVKMILPWAGKECRVCSKCEIRLKEQKAMKLTKGRRDSEIILQPQPAVGSPVAAVSPLTAPIIPARPVMPPRPGKVSFDSISSPVALPTVEKLFVNPLELNQKQEEKPAENIPTKEIPKEIQQEAVKTATTEIAKEKEKLAVEAKETDMQPEKPRTGSIGAKLAAFSQPNFTSAAPVPIRSAISIPPPNRLNAKPDEKTAGPAAAAPKLNLATPTKVDPPSASSLLAALKAKEAVIEPKPEPAKSASTFVPPKISSPIPKAEFKPTEPAKSIIINPTTAKISPVAAVSTPAVNSTVKPAAAKVDPPIAKSSVAPAAPPQVNSPIPPSPVSGSSSAVVSAPVRSSVLNRFNPTAPTPTRTATSQPPPPRRGETVKPPEVGNTSNSAATAASKPLTTNSDPASSASVAKRLSNSAELNTSPPVKVSSPVPAVNSSVAAPISTSRSSSIDTPPSKPVAVNSSTRPASNSSGSNSIVASSVAAPSFAAVKLNSTVKPQDFAPGGRRVSSSSPALAPDDRPSAAAAASSTPAASASVVRPATKALDNSASPVKRTLNPSGVAALAKSLNATTSPAAPARSTSASSSSPIAVAKPAVGVAAKKPVTILPVSPPNKK